MGYHIKYDAQSQYAFLNSGQIANETDILILGGSVGATAFTSVWRYNVASENFESLPDPKAFGSRGGGSCNG